ncbi:hypothetical protein P3X46_029754 [Hevea brasiliensis]|uniref:Ribosomal protein L34Ae n=1 Tax=Hevea brasiliensis TaxID=3981 RepID=A0ABQ9KWL7_HEVBR|nr:uncharacterized protein LOC110640298 [Hevea brasiliensis]KAJ9147617.1 hypothetical protein P3X46_029754 [Hevea brasiliensis]
MAVLASCWLIIESIVIPDGFVKWFYLSFYIHPIFLFVCHIFLWLKLILKCLSVVFFYPLKITSCVCLYVFKVFKDFVIYVFSFTRLTNTEASREEAENYTLVQNCIRNQIVTSYGIASISCQLKVLQLQKYYVREEETQVSCEDEHMEEENMFFDEGKGMIDDSSSICSTESSSFLNPYKAGSFVHWELLNCAEAFTKDANLNECIPSICSSNSSADENLDTNEYSSLFFSSNKAPEDQDINEYSRSICSFNLPAVVEREEPNGLEDQDLDAFYSKYIQIMGWFDVLNYDRTCGISAILSKQVIGTPNSFESVEPVDFSVFPYMSLSKTVRKRLLRSLESDFELVYVAQSCLSWEALHHQYIKVEALANSSSQNGLFSDNVAGEFQKFQVLLERFMEDERCEGKRVWNYVRGRFSRKSLLQVPKVSGLFEQEMEKEAIDVKEVLKAIERCIEAFWTFVKTDSKKPWWKLRSSLWTCPPVEDPRDLKLLADLTRTLHKKELWLKDSEGKQRCWFRRVVKPDIEESQRKEMLFTMIYIKLISRVLQLPVLSSAQLNWCQEKLDNIQFQEGKIVRASSSGLLFPP